MKKTRKLAAALGLLALPLFTGAWTTAPQAQQQEEPIEAVAVKTVGEINGSPVVMSVYEDTSMSHGYNNYIAGSSSIGFIFRAIQADWLGTDNITYSFKLNNGPNAQVRIKVLFFWGNNTILHGDEVTIGPFTVGSNGCSGSILCNQGGIPTSSETDNRRWNCNFAVVSMQVKSNSVKTESFMLDWHDGDSDSSRDIIANHEEDKYISMLSPWGRW